tara:strand:+ start:836 stop:1279 length:444 start_codon:yes stop_codon:yes gene_type:complete
MTLAMPKKRGKKKREEMELPANVRRGLIAHSEGLSWIEASKVANLTPHAMRQWRKHPDAENFINFAINSSLEESLGTLAQSTPALAERLIKIALDDKTRGYTCVSAIQTAFSILQSGIVDRENKSELKKLREVMERLEGEPSGIIDI